MVATIRIQITGDANSAQRAADQAASSYEKFGAGMQQLAVPAGIAVAAIGGFAKAAIDSASNTQQAMGAVDSVFGSSAGAVKEWAAAAAHSVGMSESSYGQLAAVVGASMQSMGMDQAQAADQTSKLITMGADLAATYGGTTQEAVEALGSALRGEADPAERFGLSLKDSAVKAKMAAEGTDKLTGAAYDAARVQAIMALATEQAAGANGQFARETDSAAGSAQIAAAEYENAKAVLGEQLLPVMAAVTEAFAGFAKWVGENSTLVLTLAGIVGGLAAAVLVINGAMAVAAAAQAAWSAAQLIGTAASGGLTTATAALSAAMAFLAANPIILVIAAIVAVVAAVVLLWNKSDAFREFILGMWDAVTGAATACWEAIKGAAVAAWDWITGKVREAADFIAGVWEAIKSGAPWEWIKEKAAAAWGWIVEKANAAGEVIRGIWENIKSVGVACWEAIKWAVDALLTPFRAVKDAVQWLIDKLKAAWDWATKLLAKIPFVGDMIGGTAAPAVSAVPAAASVYRAAPVTGGALTRTRSAAGGGIVVNVSGALDPVAVANQIESLLLRQRRRTRGTEI